MIVVRPKHPLLRAEGAARARLDFAGYPCVLPPSGTLIRQVADGFLARHGIAASAGRIETLDIALARAMVLQGDHLLRSLRRARCSPTSSGALVRLPPRLTPEEAVGLMLRTDRSRIPECSRSSPRCVRVRRFDRRRASARGSCW